MEQVAPRVALLALKKVGTLVVAAVLYLVLLAVFMGVPLLVAPVCVDVAASFGYKVSEAYVVASLLGGGIAGTLTAFIMQKR